MGSRTRTLLTIVATLGTVGVLGLGFVLSGRYNMAADDHHTKPVLAMIELLRERSIAYHARDVSVPALNSTGAVAKGAELYSAHCAGCHLAPGVLKSDLRRGLYPIPPNLPQEEQQEPKRAFWIVKHGIKMTAMPAWGKVLADDQIWDVVAFVQKLPTMTPDTYQSMIEKSEH
jgi:mono/diheme cytochrome c family protein